MITVSQSCDRCAKTRRLKNDSMKERTSNNWRQLPCRVEFGEARDEQPILCPDCCGVVADVIDQEIGSDPLMIVNPAPVVPDRRPEDAGS